MTVLETLEQSGYRPTEEELRELLVLARNVGEVKGKVEGGYFKVLLTKAIDEGDIKKAHGILYPLVKEVCTTASMTAKEKNSATNFARSAYSTLKSYRKAGGFLNPDLTKAVATEALKTWRSKEAAVLEEVVDYGVLVQANVAYLNELVRRGVTTKEFIIEGIKNG